MLPSGSLLPSLNVPALPPEELSASAPIDLRALIGSLLRRWKRIIAVPLLLLLAVFGGLRLVPPVYQSSVQILIFNPQQPGRAAIGQESLSAQDFDTVAINTEIAIIKSAALMQRVARDLKLDEYPEFQAQTRLARLLDQLGLSRNRWIATHLAALFADQPGTHSERTADPAAAAEKRIATAAAILSNHIRIEQVQLAYVLVVSASSRSPQLAQRLAAQIADDYLTGQREAWQKALDQLALWLKAKLTELKTRIVETDTEIEKLKAATGITDTSKGTVNQQQIADLNTQLIAVRADVAEKRAQLEQARQLAADNGALVDIPEAVTSPLISQLRLQKSMLTQMELQLRARLGDRHAEVLAVAAQLAGVNKAIHDEEAHILADLQNSYDIAVRREQSVEASLQRLASAPSNADAFAKLQQLQRNADADGKLYDTYISQYNDIVTRQSLENMSERIISPATVPTAPVFPRPSLFYLGAGGMGIALGVLLAYVAEYLQQGVRMGAEAEQMFGYPVVGNVPFLPRRRSWRAGRRAGARGLVEAALRTPLSPLNEAVRGIRIGLHLSNREHDPKVILVTSSLPGEGKSTLAALLATSSAGAGQRTILLDGDVRGRSISRDFAPQRSGLTDLLSGTASLASVTVHDPDTGCDVIAAGSRMRNPGDLLASRRMAEIIARLRESYDYVVVDTPPLLSVIDALALAGMADKILVTIDGSFGHHDSITEAFRLLRPEARRVAGIVFNKVAPEQLRRYGYVAVYPYDL